MRDQHRPKQDLINEVIGLRKQVADLKQAAVVRWRAEEALRRSEEQYRALVDYVPGGICRLSAAGEVLQVNGTFAAMLGYDTRGEAVELGRTIGIFATEDERERVLDAFRIAEGLRDLPAKMRHRRGGTLRVLVSGRAVREPVNGRAIQGFALLITPAGE